MRDIVGTLKNLPGIRDVRLNAAALSLVVEYDKSVIGDDAWRDIFDGTDAQAAAAIDRLGWRG